MPQVVEQVILKNRQVPASMDYAFLRKEGIRFIQEFVGQGWTDYNIHDPGVTILEVLCYALTELGYRTDFPIENLLASHPAKGSDFLEDFTLPDDILPMAPLTRFDFKKLLLDIPGVRNAWFEKSNESEQPVPADPDNPTSAEQKKITLNGLFLIVLELDRHPQLGDIHNNIIQRTITIPTQTGPQKCRIEIAHPYWDEIDHMWRDKISVSAVTISQLTPFVDSRTREYFLSLAIDIDPRQNSITDFELRIKFIDQISPNDETSEITALRTLVSDPAQLISAFNEKMQAVFGVLDEIETRLHANRNLSEDYYQIKAARVQEIGIKTTIRIKAGADADQMLAEIIFGLTRFFSPKAKFYGLRDMLAKDKSLDQIFEGPLLSHGFLIEDELEPYAREGVIFTSDVIHILMDIVGVVSVEDFSMTNYINNQMISADVQDSLILPRSELFKPKLSVEKSNIVVLKSDIPQQTDQLRLQNYLDRIKKREEKKAAVNYQEELEFPEGQRLALESYHSIQDDFPDNYGIGTIGLPESVAEKRKAQAKQLKAYLLFFEQLVINSFAQLAHIRDLLSTDSAIDRTYFYQPLYQVPGVALLLKDFIGQVPVASDDSDFNTAWNHFKSDPHNAYLTGLSTALEDRDLYNHRRNQFLNHLLARFCENFTDYSLSVFDNWGSNLIRDKATFLEVLPPLSAKRGIAFNYRLKNADGRPMVWYNDNIAALARKLSYLLGFSRLIRKNLSPDAVDDFERYQETDADGNQWFKFRLRDENDTIILTGVTAHPNPSDLEQEIKDVVGQGSHRIGYRVDPADDGRYLLKIVDRQNEPLAEISEKFDNPTAAESARNQILDLFHRHEGFFLIEHILLRPKFSGRYANITLSDKYLKLTENESGEKIPITDPYSFRVSFFFPQWTPKLSEPGFKEYIKRTIARELPAHIIAHVFFLSKDSMKQFEKVYKNWLERNCLEMPLDRSQRDLHIIALHKARAKLLDQMNSIAKSP